MFVQITGQSKWGATMRCALCLLKKEESTSSIGLRVNAAKKLDVQTMPNKVESAAIMRQSVTCAVVRDVPMLEIEEAFASNMGPGTKSAAILDVPM
jgi:hypothetical protein